MDRAPKSRCRRAADLLVVAVFLAVIAAPAVDQLARPSSARSALVEFRQPAKRPKLPRSLAQLTAFPTAFTRWYDDQYGLRDRFLHLNSYVRWFGLESSPSPRIVHGGGDWIFVEEGDSIESWRGARPMSRGLLEAWRRTLEARRDWLASLGIEYLFVASPSKLEVYPERVPARFMPVGPPRTRQLLEHLAARSDVPLLDLLPVALAAKAGDAPDDHAYYPLGDHWTDRAAHDAYVALLETLGERLPGLEPLPRAAFEVARSDEQGDSWAGRMYLAGELRQTRLEWRLRAPRAALLEGRPNGPLYVAGRRDGEGPRALLLHDSFSLPMRPWLAEHFAPLEARWSDRLDPARVLAERPDVVIECFNDFTLLRHVPHASPEEDAGARAARFEAAEERVWRLDPRAPAWRLRTTRARRPRAEGERLVFEPSVADELLELPELRYPPGRDLLLRVELEASGAGALGLYYRTELAPTLERGRRVTLPLVEGRQTLVLELPEARFTGRLALQVEGREAKASFVELELRAART